MLCVVIEVKIVSIIIKFNFRASLKWLLINLIRGGVIKKLMIFEFVMVVILLFVFMLGVFVVVLNSRGIIVEKLSFIIVKLSIDNIGNGVKIVSKSLVVFNRLFIVMALFSFSCN